MYKRIDSYPVRSGKVRDVYDIGNNSLIIVATDRISAFDRILPTLIPDKGRILTQISLAWADILDVKYHLVTDEIGFMPPEFRDEWFKDRTVMVDKAEVIPFECVVRGYLAGSAWKEYKNTGKVNGIELPKGLQENQNLFRPIFTPTTKSDGHDESVTFSQMADVIGCDLAEDLEIKSIDLYQEAAEYAWRRGIIIADTKFEWGILRHAGDEVILIDEILTPDSSRFWPLEKYKLGGTIPSYDKQPVRDWLEHTTWVNDEPPALHDDIVYDTQQRYMEILKEIKVIQSS